MSNDFVVKGDSSANWWDWPLQSNDAFVQLTNTDEKFEVGLEVQLYKPNEIEVKVCGEEIVISCRHDPKKEDLYKSLREVNRAYRLPHDVDLTTLRSHLTNRGMLMISAAKKK